MVILKTLLMMADEETERKDNRFSYLRVLVKRDENERKVWVKR
jgi:hypothetical protein